MAKKKVRTLQDVLTRSLLALEIRCFKSGTISHVEFRDAFLFISNHMKADVAGSLDVVRKFSARPCPKLTAVHHAPQLKSEKAIRVEKRVDQKAIAKKWADKTQGATNPVLKFDHSREYPNSPFADLAIEPLPATEAGAFVCSFCKQPTSYTSATIGKKTSIMIIPELVMVDGEPEIEERVTSKTRNLIACPACSLRVKPKEQRWINPEAI